MRFVRRAGFAVAAAAVATFVALMPTPGIAHADNPSSPDDTVLDAVDSVLSENGSAPAMPAPSAETPVPAATADSR